MAALTRAKCACASSAVTDHFEPVNVELLRMVFLKYDTYPEAIPEGIENIGVNGADPPTHDMVTGRDHLYLATAHL